MKPTDVVIIGAGVLGCATALELARRGRTVRVLERSVPGAEASSAAAGMLAAQVEAHNPSPFVELCTAGRERFGPWAAELARRTGIDIEHRTCGILKFTLEGEDSTALRKHASWQREAGLDVALLDRKQALELEPELSPRVDFAVHYPRDARVDPPRLLRALRIGAERAGAHFSTGATVRRVVEEGGRARGVELDGGERVDAGLVVLAAGSWSSQVGGVPLPAASIRPARGQVVELTSPVPRTRGIVWGTRGYLCPRDDGRVLVGSTLEFVGYERAVTARAVRDLLDGALTAIPALASAELSRTWAAFRPYTPHELPFIGESGTPGLLLATGHYRNGILLAPITAEIVAAIALGERPPIDPSPYTPAAALA
ncbi:MAG: glycine oxidase ThiO [Polyangiaceae bacterium]